MFTADRLTHLKIVVMSLICATMVAGVGIAARVTSTEADNGRHEASLKKASAPLTATKEMTSTIR
jgi:hypothetical protein